MKKVLIYSDGASRGNPGQASIGAVIMDESGNVIREISKYLGVATNNEAEYTALIEALEAAGKMPGITEIDCFADSQLMVRQLNGVYKVSNARMKKLFDHVKKLACGVTVNFTYVPREKNRKADRLANLALDTRPC